MDGEEFTFSDLKYRFDRAFGLTDYKNEKSLKDTITAYRRHVKHSLFVFITDETQRTRVAWVFAAQEMPPEERPEAFDAMTYRYLLMGENRPSFYVDSVSDKVAAALINQVVAEAVATDVLRDELDDSPVRQKIIRHRTLSAFFAKFSNTPVMALHIVHSQNRYLFGGLEFLIHIGELSCLLKS